MLGFELRSLQRLFPQLDDGKLYWKLPGVFFKLVPEGMWNDSYEHLMFLIQLVNQLNSNHDKIS